MVKRKSSASEATPSPELAALMASGSAALASEHGYSCVESADFRPDRQSNSSRSAPATYPAALRSTLTQVWCNRRSSGSSGRSSSGRSSATPAEASTPAEPDVYVAASGGKVDAVVAALKANPALLNVKKSGGIFDSRTLLHCRHA